MKPFFKLGTIIKSNSGKKFIVKRSTERFICKDCVFSIKYNPDFDSHRFCDERRNSYLNLKRGSYDSCEHLVPPNCVFAELKGGV